MSRGRSVRETTRTDQLSGIDHGILALLQAHRVLTTPQLITLTGRPERTIDYRLARLRARSLVDRTRPYAASGSAPFFWWLTRSGARLVEGTSPAPGKGTPNPLFLRHTAAIAGLYVALLDAGPTVGLQLTGLAPGRGRLGGLVQLLTVPAGSAPTPTPKCVSTSTAPRVSPGRSWRWTSPPWTRLASGPRWPATAATAPKPCGGTATRAVQRCCLVTTSEARVNHFLAGVERDRPRPSPYQREHPAHYDELVAACATVASPEEAVTAPVWRAAVADAPVTLAQLLSPEVRQYRRVVARVDARPPGRRRSTPSRAWHVTWPGTRRRSPTRLVTRRQGRPSAMCSERRGA